VARLSHEAELEQYILDGMARTLWVHAFMIWSTEVDPAPVQSGSWNEVAPDTRETRSASMQAAQALTELLATANRLDDREPLAHLFLGGRYRRTGDGTEADRASVFGDDLALVCLGALEVDDSMLRGRTDIVLPSFTVALHDDARATDLRWEGAIGADGPHHNPRNPDDGPEILLIEDDPRLQRSTSRWIKKLYPTARLLVADNAPAAIGNLQTHDVTLIVSDFDLIGPQTGGDVFAWVRAQQPHLVDRFVFFTGNSQAAELHYRVVAKGGATVEELKTAIRAPAPDVGAPARHVRAPSPAGPDVSVVAAAVLDVLPKIEAVPSREPGKTLGRFGPDNVFISSIWVQLAGDPRFRGTSFDEFKRLLIDANRRGLLVLARADMIGAMDAAEVRDSEIIDRGSNFHFVQDSGGWSRPAATSRANERSAALVAQAVVDVMPKIKATPSPEDGMKTMGRFGPQKVFISALWRKLAAGFSPMTLEQFKRKLLEANRLRLLDLSRADLVGAMDNSEVMESEIKDHGAEFHFVTDRTAAGW
jgi:CheY-like chemotaxis protein